MDAREFLAEPCHEGVAEAWVPHQAMGRGDPGHEARNVELAADEARVALEPKRLRHGNTRGVGGSKEREFVRAALALRHPLGGGRGAHDEDLGLAVDLGVDAPILLHGTAAEALECGDAHGARASTLRDEGRKRTLDLLRLQPHDQKSVPSWRSARESTILCTSLAPSTSLPWRA